MANLQIRDGAGLTKYIKGTGVGSDGDPFIVEKRVVQATHDSLNLNANLQVGDADVANGNPVPISDAGGSITIDGTVAVSSGTITVTALPAGTNNIGDVDVATLPGTVEADIGTIDTNVATVAGAVAGSEMQVDVVAFAPTVTTTDSGPTWTQVLGVSNAAVTSADMSASPTAVTDAPTGGQKLVITDIILSADTQMTVSFTEETSGRLIYRVYLPADGTAQLTPRSFHKLATADKKLMAQTSVSGNITITAAYFSEA